MLQSDWLESHKKEIGFFLILCLALAACLLLSTVSKGGHLTKKDGEIVAITRESTEQTVTLPLEVETEKDGEIRNYQVTISLKGLPVETDETEGKQGAENAEIYILEDAVTALVEEIEDRQETKILLPTKLEDGTRLRWTKQRDFRFLLVFLLLPIGLLYIYETERQQKKTILKRYEEELRRALPSFVDQLLLLLHAGMIFHDAFYRITDGYAVRTRQDAFSRLILRIRKEADETGAMVITVMKNLSQEVGLREYVRMVNILMDHQQRGVDLEEKLQAESRLLWEGRKAEAMRKGKEMETKMTFPLAVLLIVLMMIAGTPALMNM